MLVVSSGLAAVLIAPQAVRAQYAEGIEPEMESGRVNFEGVANAMVVVVGAGPAIPNRTRVDQWGSQFRITGSEVLRGGLKAIFQVESGVSLDGSGDGGAAFGVGSRNTNIGLTGPFGTVFVGKWDTPYKVATYVVSLFGEGSIAGYAGIMGNVGVTGNNLAQGASFNRRQHNVVQYWSPDILGFSAILAYGANEERSATVNPSLLGFSVSYSKDPVLLTGAYERHKDYGAGVVAAGQAGATDTGRKLVASYRRDGTMVAVAYEHLRYAPSPTTEMKRNSALLAASSKIGSGTTRMTVTWAGRTKGNATSSAANIIAPCTAPGVCPGETGGKQLAIGHGYAFSKRTELYGIWTRVWNQPRAAYNLGMPVPGNVTGLNPMGYGIGLRHNF
jgi:predicted porin